MTKREQKDNVRSREREESDFQNETNKGLRKRMGEREG